MTPHSCKASCGGEGANGRVFEIHGCSDYPSCASCVMHKKKPATCMGVMQDSTKSFQMPLRSGTGQEVLWRRQSGTTKPEPTKRSQAGIALLVLGLVGAGVAGYLVVKALK